MVSLLNALLVVIFLLNLFVLGTSRISALVRTAALQGMALGTVGTFILLAFLTYNTADVSWNSYSNEGGIHNLGGRLGAQIADLFFTSFGLASYLIPMALLYMAYTLFRFKEIRLRSYKLLASFGLIFSLSTLFAFFRDTTSLFGQQVATGGVVGKLTCNLLKGTVGATGVGSRWRFCLSRSTLAAARSF